MTADGGQTPAEESLALRDYILQLADRVNHLGGQRQRLGPAAQSALDVALQTLAEALARFQAIETELQRHDAALAAVRRRYEQLVALLPDTYLVTDLSGRILDANRAVSNLLSVPRTYVLRKPLASFVVADDVALLTNQLTQLASAAPGTVAQFQLRLRPRRHGAVRLVAVRAAAAPSDDASVTELWWLLREVTDPRAGLAALQVAHDREAADQRDRLMELAATVRMTNAALAQDRARQTRAVAAVDELIAAGGADVAALVHLRGLLTPDR